MVSSISFKISQKYFCIYLAAIRFCLICRQAPRRLLLSVTQHSSDRIIRKLGCIAITEVCGEVKERMCKRHAQQNLFLVTVVVVGNRHNRAGGRGSKHCDSFCWRCAVALQHQIWQPCYRVRLRRPQRRINLFRDFCQPTSIAGRQRILTIKHDCVESNRAGKTCRCLDWRVKIAQRSNHGEAT